MLWVAVAAWALVAVAFLARLVRHPHEPSSGSPAPSPGTAPAYDMTTEKKLP